MKSEARHRRKKLIEAAALCVLAYLTALGAAVGVGHAAGQAHPLLVAGAADLAGTCVVFLFSVVLNNSSFYDPYWSIAPPVIALYWASMPESGEADFIRRVIVAALVCVWGARLTTNWARGWEGLGHEDWRYVDIRRRSAKAYWPASFVGIHLFPTAVVFLGCLSLYPALVESTGAFGLLDIAAAAVTASAIWIEAAADKQLMRFRKSAGSSGRILSTGLWAYSRHPNYFGEILFWWGLYIFALSADPSYWWTIAGPLAITLLFWFISVPMIEKRMLGRRPRYAARMKNVSMIVPWFPRERQKRSLP